MHQNRSHIIIKSGYLFILTNFLLAFLNIVIGLISNSIAIISDALHSLIDAVSGILIIISEKLSKHYRFSHRRVQIERITTVTIASIIIMIGIHLVIESIEKILQPEITDYSIPVIIILIASIIAKYILAFYLKKTSKKTKSKVLEVSSVETVNDALISVAVLISALIYIIWQIDIEAYVSLAISAIIIKVGLEFIFPHFTKHHHHHLESDSNHQIKRG